MGLKIFHKVKIFITICISLFTATISLYSQESFTDSLKVVLECNLPDSVKIDLINELVVENANNYPHLAIPFSEIAIKKSEEIKDSIRLSRSLNRKAVAFYFMGDYNNALEYYLKSLQISEKLNIVVNIVSDYNNIGLVLFEEKLYEEALNYFIKAKGLIETTDRKDLLARVYDNIGMVYYSTNEPDTALVWFEKSLKINREIDQKQTMGSNIKNVGKVFIKKENYPLALTHFQLALGIYQELGIKLEIAGLLNNISFVNTKLGEFKEAERYLSIAKDLIVEINSTSLLMENYRIRAELFKSKDDLKKSILSYEGLVQIKDSVELYNRRKTYEQLQALAETNEKVKDLELLKKLSAVQNEKIKSQRTIQIGIFILLLLSVSLLILIINSLRLKNRTNRRLEELVLERTKELKLAKEQAEQSDRLKTAFLENISHEVRTPMNAIVGFSDLLINHDYEEEDRVEMLKNLSNSTLRLLNLFEKISMLAQLENNDVTIIESKCRFDDMFLNLRNKYFKRLNDCELAVNINYFIQDNIKNKDFTLPARTIELILDELLDNATKFTPKGLISFGVMQENGFFNFYIKDTGEGIEPDEIENVFNKFVKFHNSHCNMCDGAGIGLTIVKKNLELISGSISISSEKNKGTLVEFKVPY